MRAAGRAHPFVVKHSDIQSIASDAVLLAYRELDDALELTATAALALAERRRGKNIRHRLLGLFRQAVYGQLAGCKDGNDVERLARDPAMRASIGREGMDRLTASTSERGRFRTEWLAPRPTWRCSRSCPAADRPAARAPARRRHPRHGQLRERTARSGAPSNPRMEAIWAMAAEMAAER